MVQSLTDHISLLINQSDLDFNIVPFCFTGQMLQLSCFLACLGEMVSD